MMILEIKNNKTTKRKQAGGVVVFDRESTIGSKTGMILCINIIYYT
jgi:hypothetical protein